MLDRLLVWNLAALVAILVLAHIIMLCVLVRRGPGAAPKTLLLPSLVKTELFPTLLCCVVFAAMAITSERLWAALRFEGADPAAMQVEVVGQQFQWYFRYPGDDARFGLTRPQLVNAAAGNPLGLDQHAPAAHDDIVSSVLLLPAGREVDLRLRALDVIHGFFIPGMRLKQNAVPGLELHVHFTPVTPGSYPILCTQVCGSGHARMQAVLRVVPPEQFTAWIAARERALVKARAE
jgi:cytochrome c oxidase subunit 2